MVNQTFVGTTESQSSLSVNFRTAITGEAVDAAIVGNDIHTVVKLPAASAMYGMHATILADEFSGAIPAESLSGPALSCGDCFTTSQGEPLAGEDEAFMLSGGQETAGGIAVLAAGLAAMFHGGRSEQRNRTGERKRVSLRA